jgi:peroxiredoxin
MAFDRTTTATRLGAMALLLGALTLGACEQGTTGPAGNGGETPAGTDADAVEGAATQPAAAGDTMDELNDAGDRIASGLGEAAEGVGDAVDAAADSETAREVRTWVNEEGEEIVLALGEFVRDNAVWSPSVEERTIETDAGEVELAPDFALLDTKGSEKKLSDFAGHYVVIEWFDETCPYVQKHHVQGDTMTSTFQDYAFKFEKPLIWLAINSNRGSDYEHNAEVKQAWKIPYPVLSDQTGIVAEAYGATNTPHMFLVDPDGKIIYEGAIDSDSSVDTFGETNYVAQALEEVIAGEPVSVPETKAYGCTIKN